MGKATSVLGSVFASVQEDKAAKARLRFNHDAGLIAAKKKYNESLAKLHKTSIPQVNNGR